MQETQETWVQSLSREDPLEEEMAAHSSILAWRILWTEEPGGLSPRVMKSRTWLSNWASTHLFYSNAERLASWHFATGSQQWIAAEYRGSGACSSHSWQTNCRANTTAQGTREHTGYTAPRHTVPTRCGHPRETCLLFSVWVLRHLLMSDSVRPRGL